MLKDFRKQFARHPVARFFSSVKLTVIGLLVLFILVFWGTIAQVDQGLYLAQERYFNSTHFFIQDIVPFPGARLVLWVLFINLAFVAVFRLPYTRRHAGIVIIHYSLILLLVAGFITFHWIEESHLGLYEGETSNVSSAYHQWEMALWEQDGIKRLVTAYDTTGLNPGDVLTFQDGRIALLVETYYSNSRAFRGAQGQDEYLNVDGIQSLQWRPKEKEPEQNTPGATFLVKDNDRTVAKLLLYGGQEKATTLEINGDIYFASLRRKRYPLPFTIKLLDFKMDRHPGTEIASEFESDVEINPGDAARKVNISMNNPLRYKDYTFYQASYAIDQFGAERSTLAVVKNKGRILPYVATILTFLGLVMHFGGQFIAQLNKRRKRPAS